MIVEYIAIITLIIGFINGILINKLMTSYRINKIEERKRNELNDIFETVSNSIEESTFFIRSNSVFWIKMPIGELGIVDIAIEMLDKLIVIYDDGTPIYTSSSIDKEKADLLFDKIYDKHKADIEDVVNILGTTISRKELEKAINMKIDPSEVNNMKVYVSNSDMDMDIKVATNPPLYEINEILDKIKESGLNSLTVDEKEFLDHYSKDL